MSETDAERMTRTYARIAGAGYLIIIITGIFAEFFVRSSLIRWDDPAATARNIADAELLFRTGIAGEFVMLASDVLLALALYVVFRGVSRNLALLAAFFRLAHAAIVGGNLLNSWVPLLLLGQGSYLGAFEPDQLHALALLFLDAHAYGYVIGLVFFGAHCLILGYLVYHSRYVPRVLGALLILAAAGYLIDGFARTLLPEYERLEGIFTLVVLVPAFIGELSFSLWLLIKGIDLSAGKTRPAPEAS